MNGDKIMEHEHDYKFISVVYFHEGTLPGTGAVPRYLEDCFYCSKCLHYEYTNRRPFGHSYNDIPVGMMPKKGYTPR